jgi:thermitase
MRSRATIPLAIVVCSALYGALTGVVGEAQGERQQSYVAEEILIKYVPSIGIAAAYSISATYGLIVREFIPELGVYRLGLPADRTVDQMLELCRQDPRCEYAEPNYLGEGGDVVPNDPFLSAQWHLHNVGQTGGTPDADIDALEGWQTTTGSSSIVVAVLDTGIDFGHPEFEGRTLAGFDFVNDDPDPQADHPHGVFVSGILAANADNGFSVAGVDHHVSILPVKVLDVRNLGTTADLAQGLVFAAGNGARVINMSLINYPLTFTLNAALQFARDAGAILVACAGNGGLGDADRSGPGASPLTISVGATTQNDARASFSGTGNALDVVAPGLGVITVASDRANGVASFSGCSAATPIVSGVATLLLSLNPQLTHDDVLNILAETADDSVGPPQEDTPGRDNFFGYGRVNLNNALRRPAPPPTCDVNADGEVDRNDIDLIFEARNSPASPGDPRDVDRDGLITVADARSCALQCSQAGCET